MTAGRFVLDKNARGDALGRFVYGRSYLENQDAVEFDPVELKLSTRTYETAQLNGVFGALRDAGPDYWGRRVIEKHAGKAQLGELDYLLESPDDRRARSGSGTTTSRPPRSGNSTRRSISRNSRASPMRWSRMKSQTIPKRSRSKT